MLSQHPLVLGSAAEIDVIKYISRYSIFSTEANTVNITSAAMISWTSNSLVGLI